MQKTELSEKKKAITALKAEYYPLGYKFKRQKNNKIVFSHPDKKDLRLTLEY